MSSPARVILKAVALMASATVVMSASFGRSASTARTTPGPDTPTFTTSSASPDAVEGAGHEGVVLHGVAEHDELAGADALACRR